MDRSETSEKVEMVERARCIEELAEGVCGCGG